MATVIMDITTITVNTTTSNDTIPTKKNDMKAELNGTFTFKNTHHMNRTLASLRVPQTEWQHLNRTKA